VGCKPGKVSHSTVFRKINSSLRLKVYLGCLYKLELPILKAEAIFFQTIRIRQAVSQHMQYLQHSKHNTDSFFIYLCENRLRVSRFILIFST
jgi:hypothetical protein